MEMVKSQAQRRTALVCAACRRVFRVRYPAASDNGALAPAYVRVGVCRACRSVVREWALAELHSGHKLEAT